MEYSSNNLSRGTKLVGDHFSMGTEFFGTIVHGDWIVWGLFVLRDQSIRNQLWETKCLRTICVWDQICHSQNAMVASRLHFGFRIISNVLSAPIFLECRSAPAPCQKKECHSHFAPFNKKEWHSSLALSKKSALFSSLFFLKKIYIFNIRFSSNAWIWRDNLPVKNLLFKLHWNYLFSINILTCS